tara:strand:+ start:155 stop:442 length:288 start_codon:yes stop_codon:yes gene_type:complete
MSKKISTKEYVKKIIKQISGNVDENDELIPEVGIVGSGDIWCWDPIGKTHKKIYRGVKAFVLYVNYDSFGRTLIYTHGGDMVCIDPDELFYIGFD